LLDEVDGIVIGGSKWSVFEDVPNLSATQEFLRAAGSRQVPVLGVCFGHQLLATTFGGEVMRDEANEEFGSYEVTLNETGKGDTLFAGLPEKFKAICGHHDAVSKLPEEADLLASSEKCPIHAFKLKNAPVYGVQFHPEHTAETFERVMRTVGRKYFSDSGKVDDIISRIDPAPHASSVLARFIDRIVLGR